MIFTALGGHICDVKYRNGYLHYYGLCCTLRFLLLIIHIAMSLCLYHYRNGHLTVVQYLVEKCSADVNLIDEDGCTSLYRACL